MEKQISPGLKATFLVGFIVAGIFGLIYVLVPQVYQNLVGSPIKQATEAAAFRALGAAFLGLATAGWFAYKETAWDKVKIVVQMALVWMILGTLVMLWGLFFTGLPAISWLYAVIYAGFAVAFGVFYPRG